MSHVRIAVVQGSVRPGNYTAKAVALVLDQLEQHDVQTDLIDPNDFDLVLPGRAGGAEGQERLQEIARSATGLVFATPEYHGTFSAATKLVIENLGFPSVLATKPVALLGVAGGVIGAVKSLEHLRSVLSHVGAIVLPGPTSVARVQAAFNEEGRCTDEAVERRVRGTATALVEYIQQNLCPRAALERMAREDA